MPAALDSNRIDSSSHRLSILTSQHLVVQQPAIGLVSVALEPACIAEPEMQEVEQVLAATPRGCVIIAMLPPGSACSSSVPWCSSSPRQPTDRTVEMWSSAVEPMATSRDCPPFDEKVVNGPSMAESSEVKAEHYE